MTLTGKDDLDFGIKEMVLPHGIYNYVNYESSITYHSQPMANVKVFADKQTGQTDKRTGDLSMLGHKKYFRFVRLSRKEKQPLT